jgi:hypothetical protein
LFALALEKTASERDKRVAVGGNRRGGDLPQELESSVLASLSVGGDLRLWRAPTLAEIEKEAQARAEQP